MGGQILRGKVLVERRSLFPKTKEPAPSRLAQTSVHRESSCSVSVSIAPSNIALVISATVSIEISVALPGSPLRAVSGLQSVP